MPSSVTANKKLFLPYLHILVDRGHHFCGQLVMGDAALEFPRVKLFFRLRNSARGLSPPSCMTILTFFKEAEMFEIHSQNPFLQRGHVQEPHQQEEGHHGGDEVA